MLRWAALFADLEAQLDAAEAVELQAEVVDRTWHALGRIALFQRLRMAEGEPLAIGVPHLGTVHGALAGVGPDWVLLTSIGRDVLVPAAAVLSIAGLGGRTEPAELTPVVAARLDLRFALRGLARSRSPVTTTLTDGRTHAGVIDRVGLDHIDLALPADGGRLFLAIPLSALVAVQAG
jgi:hypothetical protein